MFARITSVALVGVEPCPVEVEVSIGEGGKPRFTLVGLPDTAVREAKERVQAAFRTTGQRFPGGHVLATTMSCVQVVVKTSWSAAKATACC